VLLTAYELDLFTVVDPGGKSSAEVSQALGTAERATDRLMNALCAMGLLEKRSGRFWNTPGTSRLLVKGQPDFLAGLMHSVHLWETWGALTPCVRRGGPSGPRPVNERGQDWLQAFIAAMHWRASHHAPQVVGLLDISGVSRMLDVGGGSGAYAMAFARAKDNLSTVVFDLPNVISLTEKYIRQEGLSDRVQTMAGDYRVDELGSGFDLVLLSAILHSNSPAENCDLLRKAAQALNANGQMVVQDFIIEEDRTGPPFAALFALNMLVGTESGDTYTEAEIRRWMEGAGMVQIMRKDTAVGTSLILGKKEGN
jgi:2-polyprenyl-3-methyl-5-hydroxy-6-metoxy-1,4-benzoquinol methylase